MKTGTYLLKSAAVLLLVVILSLIISLRQVFASEIVSVEDARKIATFECQRMYGNFPEFDQLVYYDNNEQPAVYVFVFQQRNHFSSKQNLKDFIAQKYQESQRHLETIRQNGGRDPENLNRARRALREANDNIWLAEDFLTVYVSATKTRAAIPEERRGLPEAYTHRWEAENYYQSHYQKPSIEQKYYYFGPLEVYFRGSPAPTRLFNVYEDRTNFGSDSLSLASYRIPTNKRTPHDQERLSRQWSFFLDSLNAQTWDEYAYQPLETDVSLSNVPDFRQDEFNGQGNLFPAGGSCAVMAVGSAFGYYDSHGYWNLTDLAEHQNGVYYPQGGFDQDPGFPKMGPAAYEGGVEDMLFNIALAIGYDFSSGGTLPINTAPGAENFANLNNFGNNLNFNITPNFSGQGCTYNSIQTHINNQDPVLVGMDHFWWGDSGGPYPLIGNHLVIIVGYNTNMGYWYSQGIYVYLNGGGPLGQVSWDYADLQNKATFEFTDGGSPGTLLNPPTLLAPVNGSIEENEVEFDWSDVPGATKYWLQIANNSNFDAGVQNYETTNPFYSVALDSGVYYWHVVPRNDHNNWCHFSSINSFSIADSLNGYFVVTIGQDKIFQDFNYDSTWFADDPNNLYPWPEEREAYVDGNNAHTSLVAIPIHAGEADARIGASFDWDLAGYNWEEIKYWPIIVTFDFSYSLEAYWFEGYGSANAGVYILNFPWSNWIGYEAGIIGTRTDEVQSSYQTNVEQLNLNGRELKFGVGCQAHCQSDSVGWPVHISSADIQINSIEIDFDSTYVGVIEANRSKLPERFICYSPSPNPFNPTTTLRFDLPVACRVKLEVFDVSGRNVTSIGLNKSEMQMPAGSHEVTFNGTNLPSGIYFLRLQAGEYTGVQKLVLLK